MYMDCDADGSIDCYLCDKPCQRKQPAPTAAEICELSCHRRGVDRPKQVTRATLQLKVRGEWQVRGEVVGKGWVRDEGVGWWRGW